MERTDKRTSLTPEHASGAAWEAVDALFDRALDQPAEARAGWVRANAESAAIADEVIALLAAADRRGVLDAEMPARLVQPPPAEDVLARLSAALQGRYRIDGVLGEGGTSTVYLAHEVKHQRPVVLKVLRPEAARWIGAERFLAEIQIIARLSHPHILALIDSGQADGLLYYVMPYVGGETLRTRLSRGALGSEEALPILRDIAAALAHAHEQRLVHRDLKPDNILIVAGHAFLMDFGIAKLRQSGFGSDIDSFSATMEGFAVGTPRYMAPEQAAGLPVDGRADVYAWGIVASEILTGPDRRTGEVPKSVSRDLRRLIGRCLDREPARRPSSGADLVARLDALVERKGRADRRPLWIGGAAVVLAIAAFVVVQTLWRSTPTLASVNGPVMVVPLTNETGDTSLAAWGRMAGDWLTQGLHQTGRVAVVPWPVALQAAEATKEKGSADRLRALAAETGARTLVTGAYYTNGDAVRFQTQVTDVRNGTVLAALPAIDVPRNAIRGAIQQLRDRMMGVFAIRTDKRLSDVPGLMETPPTYDAYRQFERAMDRMNALDYTVATDGFLASWQTDTTFVLPLVYATVALTNRGQFERADSLAHALRTREARLGAYHELVLRYSEASLAGSAQQALELAKQAMAIGPGGRAEYNVAALALSVGQVNEAIATLQSADPDRGLLKGWSPYWFVLSHAQHLAGDYEAELQTSLEARRRYPDSRAGWVHHVRALAALGRVAAVDSVLAAASALPPDTYWSQGAMLVVAGEELEAHGQPGPAKYYYSRAITWLANQLARDPAHRAHRYWMGSVYLDRGTPEYAAPYFESLVHDFPKDFAFRGLWGVSTAFTGDTALARQRLGDSPAYRRGDRLSYLARYAAISGDTERAIALWSEAEAAGLSGIVWLHAAARRELAPIAADPRFRRLGILPDQSVRR